MPGIFDKVGYQPVEDALERLVELKFAPGRRMLRFHVAIEALEDRNLSQWFDGENSRLEAVVHVSGRVSDFVREIDQLCFQRWTLIEQILCELRLFGLCVVVRVLNDALAHFEGQVEPSERDVAQFEIFYDAQRMQVVVEIFAMLAHGCVECLLSRMTKGWMPNVMRQRKRLRQIDIQIEGGRNRARNLLHFDGVRQSIAEVVGVSAGENLGLILQPAECAGMKHSIAIALEVVAISVSRLRDAPSPRVFDHHGIAGKHAASLPVAGLLSNASKRHRRGDALCVSCSFVSIYLLAEVCCASLIFADSSFFCTFATSSSSTSAGTEWLH